MLPPGVTAAIFVQCRKERRRGGEKPEGLYMGAGVQGGEGRLTRCSYVGTVLLGGRGGEGQTEI